VSISLSAESEIDFTKLNVVVYIYGNTTQTINITPTSEGECSFKVEHGLRYSVVLPAISTDGYNELVSKFNYTSSLTSRSINRFYVKDKVYETLVVTIQSVGSDGAVYGIADGKNVEITYSDGTSSSLVIANDVATAQIPIGTIYSV